jgi:hypothetical protein
VRPEAEFLDVRERAAAQFTAFRTADLYFRDARKT